MGRRAGTEAVAEMVGMGVAAQWCSEDLAKNTRPDQLRGRMEQLLAQRIPELRFNGNDTLRLPNTSNVSFKNIAASALLSALAEQEIYASAGAACGSGSLKPSHVLAAMHVADNYILGSVRLSLGRGLGNADVDKAVESMASLVVKLRLQKQRA